MSRWCNSASLLSVQPQNSRQSPHKVSGLCINVARMSEITYWRGPTVTAKGAAPLPHFFD